jgi:hypothetical protein
LRLLIERLDFTVDEHEIVKFEVEIEIQDLRFAIEICGSD